MRHVPRCLELPGAILGLCYNFITSFLPLWERCDNCGSPRVKCISPLVPRSGRAALTRLVLPHCPPAPAAPLRCSCACLGNGIASALLNGLELPQRLLGLLPLPSAPALPSLGKPHP